jgi:hypothetical protein
LAGLLSGLRNALRNLNMDLVGPFIQSRRLAAGHATIVTE